MTKEKFLKHSPELKQGSCALSRPGQKGGAVTDESLACSHECEDRRAGLSAE